MKCPSRGSPAGPCVAHLANQQSDEITFTCSRGRDSGKELLQNFSLRRFIANVLTTVFALFHLVFMIVILWLDEDVLKYYLNGIVKARMELDR